MNISKRFRAFIPWNKRRPSTSSSSDTLSLFEEQEDNYCLIKSTNLCIEATLSLISKLPVNYEETIIQEFKIVDDYLNQTCHQFDQSRTIDQFTSTDSKMGPELKLFMNFISQRYSNSTWLKCIGLILVAKKVLYSTPREVKKQLIQSTKIGREFINYMQKALFSFTCNNQQPSNDVKSQIINLVLLNEDQDLVQLLNNICKEFASNDKQFELAYEQIIYYFNNEFHCK